MRYEFHPEAEVDLVETILYYESQAPGLGERFAAEVRHAIEQPLRHPKIGAPDGDAPRAARVEAGRSPVFIRRW